MKLDKFKISVNYDQSLADAIDASRLDWASSNITSGGVWTHCVPHGQTGIVEVEVALIPFFQRISTREVRHEIYLMYCRPIDIHQLIAFSGQHPDVQLGFQVVALGSSWEHWSGRTYVPYLASYGSRRDLRLSYVEMQWENSRFAVICY